MIKVGKIDMTDILVNTVKHNLLLEFRTNLS